MTWKQLCARNLEVPNTTRDGFMWGLVAYGWWGLVPIYFAWLGKGVSPFDILAHRIAWTAVFLCLILTGTRRWPDVRRALTTPALLIPLVASALLVAYNWLMYVLSVHFQVIIQASLGYFLLPLVSIALALFIFHERMRPLQHVAIVFAGVGVALLTWEAGEFPWLSLGLGLSFGFYGLIRKQVPVDGLTGLSVETFVLLPLALAYLGVGYAERGAIEPPELLFKLSLSGIVTAVPLICFGQAARRLPLTMLGFMQYISPSLQFLLALSFGEQVRGGWWNYALVWTALVIFSIDSYLWYRRQHPAPLPRLAES